MHASYVSLCSTSPSFVLMPLQPFVYPTTLPPTMFARAFTRTTSSLHTSTRTFTSTRRIQKIYEDVSVSTFQSRVLSPTGVDAETPVLVDFYATWCQPCKLLSPALKKVATQPEVVGGKHVDLVTVDVDQHPELSQQFKVSAMPTVIALKNGKVSTCQATRLWRHCKPEYNN